MRFQTGNKFGKGRPKGSSNRLIAINAIFQVMEENEGNFIEALRSEYKRDPLSFYRTLCQPLTPKTNINISETVTDLGAILDELDKEKA